VYHPLAQLAPGPFHVHREPPARPEPGHLALGPCAGQRGQEPDNAPVALEEHLGDPGRAAEIPVNLERRMGAEEVRVSAAAVIVVAEAPGRFQQVL